MKLGSITTFKEMKILRYKKIMQIIAYGYIKILCHYICFCGYVGHYWDTMKA